MMNIDELNRRYGAPGRIVFHEGVAGYPEVVLSNKYGVAEIALLGGNVLSYRPTGHSPVLFRPAKRDYNRGEAIHGGIPVCWPQFGNRAMPGMPTHGFARVCIFSVRGSVYSEDMTEITLGLKADDETRQLWPHDFDLELKVSVSMKLNLKLTTKNMGTEPLSFSAGFHPYLLVRERSATAVRGLDGCSFVDARVGDSAVQVGDFQMDIAPDHVFSLPETPKHEFALMDPGLRRAIAVVASGCNNAVVWNPGPENRPADCGADDWEHFVCVEPVTDWPSAAKTLAPGESHALTAAIQAAADTSSES